MKDKKMVMDLLEALKAELTTTREMEIIQECENKLFGIIPSIKNIDEKTKEFNRIKFYESKREGRYFTAVSLHKAVYLYVYGEIPEGYEIHHIDFNPANNDIENLTLLTRSEHMKIHAKINGSKCRHLKSKFICKNCGKEYESVYNGTNMFCCRKCERQYNYQRTLIERHICKVCGKEFYTRKNNNQKYCSRDCLYIAQRNVDTRICLKCGKSFSCKPSSHQKYCSMECAEKSRKKRVTSKCPVCGKQFTCVPSKNKIFCSQKCVGIHLRKQK